ncbi:MAG: tyrosine-type recombinase/integrase [Candidatus Acidiferrum sp.]
MRAFFRFCADRRWTEGNPALSLKAPRIANTCSSDRTVFAFLLAPETLRVEKPSSSHLDLVRVARDHEFPPFFLAQGQCRAQCDLRALIRLMRYAGLRISDAVNLSTDRITDDKLFLYTQKTGTAVYTVLPPFVVKELAATPRVTDKLYFWSGNGELETAVKDWQAKIRTLFDLSGIDKGENFMVSHRLRDTFAVECLLAGVPLERVSILLGHSTIKVTERHYAP